MTTDEAYGSALDYLARYAADDWMMLSVVVSEARDVVGMAATKREVGRVVLSLAESLLDRSVVPGDLGADFAPWTGSRRERLDRLRRELDAMVERDQLPTGADICWFHKIDS